MAGSNDGPLRFVPVVSDCSIFRIAGLDSNECPCDAHLCRWCNRLSMDRGGETCLAGCDVSRSGGHVCAMAGARVPNMGCRLGCGGHCDARSVCPFGQEVLALDLA